MHTYMHVAEPEGARKDDVMCVHTHDVKVDVCPDQFVIVNVPHTHTHTYMHTYIHACGRA